MLGRVENEAAYADLALHAELERSGLPARDRALVTELVYGTLRWRGRIDHLLGQVLERDPARLEPRVASLLRLGAYQLVFMPRIPESAAVDESVRCAREAGLERATGLVNAALRRLARSHDRLPFPELRADPQGHLTHALSIPGWIAARWIELFGAQSAAALAWASNRVPPVAVRANPRRGSREQLLEELCTRFPDALPGRLAGSALVLGRHRNAALDPAFVAGRFTIQDEASQLVVEVLAPEVGERVLDVCAAPGTKATAIAERVGPRGAVLALDRNPRRLGLVSGDARRLGLENVSTRVADASQPLRIGASPGAFDRILVDAPCSGLGTLRRNPDLRWRLRPTDPAQLACLQGRILDRAAPFLRPGGTLVYSTCTLFPEENEAVVRAFQGRRPEFRRLAPDELPASARCLADGDGFVRTFPHRHDADGFFCARLERRP